ncbi:hypothetical protein BDZ45DRAFT_782335 [Acephala macrosclerotiorum]|nr:hypothetical protein BDZ45DRAFT_782335 [Acephala macrosclerotiorum]
MDPLTVLGAVSGAAQLAGQLLSCLNKLYQLRTRVKGAPDSLEDLYRQTRLLATTLRQMPDQWIPTFAESLEYTTAVLAELKFLVEDLKKDLKGSRDQIALYWHGLQVVAKEEKLRALANRLGAARNQLQFDITLHIAANQLATALEKRRKPPRKNASSFKVKTYCVGVGKYQKIRTRYFQSLGERGEWAEEACIKGDVRRITHLLESAEAPIFDATESGLTPLYITTAHLRMSACKTLLSCGVRGNAAETMTGRMALHIAAERSGYKINTKETTLFYDALEIIRLLVEQADGDLMAEIFGSSRMSQPLLGSGATALHLYMGPAEPMKYLLTQDKLVVDLNYSR